MRWVEVRARVAAIAVALIVSLSLVGCSSSGEPSLNKKDGTQSQEFEQEDLDRADAASDAVKDYCAGAVSDAQRVGCESHVTEDDLP